MGETPSRRLKRWQQPKREVINVSIIRCNFSKRTERGHDGRINRARSNLGEKAMAMLSRRTLISCLSALCPTGFSSEVHTRPDAGLSELGLQFDYVSSSIDLAIEGRQELCQSMLQRMDELAKAIDNQSATTLDGLRVKARVAAWALLGDLDARQDCALAQDMSRSILRDLIRNFDPNRERPGAVARLLDLAMS
jgi:hypothetical protein